ncbi:MAG TPA: ornithine cyclodeaminase family protein [Xanthobacteraceae bacterium]|jgi:ornithine cyclodeaminase/alanine dehydrogenase-like protein (mu-crystallin family)
MLLLEHQDIAGLLGPDEIIEALRQTLVEQSAGLVQVPPRTTVDSSSGFGWLRTMPAILNGSRVMGFKAMHSTPRVGVGYFVHLYDLPTGELLAMMDADWLTAQRTAAIAAIGVDILASKTVRTVGVLGSGEQARSMLIAASKVRHLPRVNVFSPTPAHRQEFAETIGREQGLNITPVERPEQAVVGCDLLLSVFRAGTQPVVAAEWIAPGMHICAASSVRPAARELEDDIWRKAAVIAVDDRAHALESGDGKSAVASLSLDAERVVELWELVSGQKRGRSSDADITLFKSVGTALQDLAIANVIYRRAKQKGLGRDVGRFPKMRPHA